MAVQIQLRRDTAADWTSANPVLAAGEMGFETDTSKFKLGDGATAWADLAYGVLDGFTSGRRYAFDDTITDADPGAGNVRFNHATFASITELYFDDTDASNGDATAWLDALDDSSNANKGTLLLQKQGDPDIYREFTVTGSVTDGTGYRKVPVSPLTENGALADADLIVVAFFRAGNAGTIETTGTKAALVDADQFIIKDSEDSDAPTGVPWNNLKTTFLRASQNGADIPDKAAFRDNLGVFGAVRTQVFTSSGTYTPNQNLIHAVIECIGAGGGGAGTAGNTSGTSGGGGGGGGSYSRSIVDAEDMGASQTVTIGAGGGGGGAGGNAGSAGGSTSVGTLCTAGGGAGGSAGSGNNGSAGGGGAGAGTGNVVAATGSPGGTFVGVDFVTVGLGGTGAPGPFGGGAPSPTAAVSAVAGNNASGYGGGGSGAVTSNSASAVAGGNGAPGIVIITEFCSE